MKINESFKKRTFVFHIGIDGGFFSEYNNMILAMLYCLKHRIRFSLFSKDANFGFEKGWSDFFHSFGIEENNLHHSKYNRRMPFTFRLSSNNSISNVMYNYFIGPVSKMKYLLNEKLFKIAYFGGINKVLFTHELWNSFHSSTMQNDYYKIPELGINGDLRDACKILLDITWSYQPEIEKKIERIITNLYLPKRFVGLHIRGGDKYLEFEFQEIGSYIHKAETLTSCKTAFVLTDDYRIIDQLNQYYPHWEFFTLCNNESKGYYHKSFSEKDKIFKRDQHINLFASVDILARSELFVGTFNSNVGMYLGIRMQQHKCFGVDFDSWLIW